jgi:hypothetical protein
MPSQDVDSLNSLKELILFTWIFLLFILSWISVAVVGRALDNFTFSTLKLNEKSTYHTVVIAIVIVIIEITTIYYFNDMGINMYDQYLPGKNKQLSIDNTNIPIFGLVNICNIDGITII